MKLTPRLMVLAVFALSVTMIASSAIAQPGGGGRQGGGRGGPGGGGPGGGGPGMTMGGMRGGGGGGAMGLLRAELIRTELGIDEATTEKVQQVAREAMQAGGNRGFEGFRDLSEDERRAKMEEMRAQMQERMKDVEKKIAEVIGMEKFGRLKEIELQMSGVEAVGRPEVADFLGLTEEQKAKIRSLTEANRNSAREKMGAVFSGGFRDMSEADRAAAMEKMGTIRNDLRKALQTEVMAVLTDEQKEKLGKMMGTPFAKMDELRQQLSSQMRGGRGGPGGEGRDGQRGGGEGRGGEGRGGQRGGGEGRGGEGRGGQRGGGEGRGGEGGQRRQRPT